MLADAMSAVASEAEAEHSTVATLRIDARRVLHAGYSPKRAWPLPAERRQMSALGHWRGMSVLSPEADMLMVPV
jgi:hypothetical protein